jgi:FO synthase subunit 2
MKPKQIRTIIRSSGKVPAQRSTTYQLLKIYNQEEEDIAESELDNADPEQFGSYHQLIKIDKFRFKAT